MFRKLFVTCASVLAITMGIVSTGQVPANADECEINTSVLSIGRSTNDPELDAILKYTIIDANGNIIFDTKSAQDNNASESVILAGEFLNGMQESQSPYQDRAIWDDATSAGSGIFSGYRYCGRGNLGGSPVNTLDRGCQQHDFCYSSKGYNKCSCDQAFINFINNNSKSMGTVEKAKAQGAKAYFWSRIQLKKCNS